LRNYHSQQLTVSFLFAGIVGLSLARAAAPEVYRPPVAELEDYQHVPVPPGFGVQHTDVDGPVFVNSQGMTLYTWPSRGLRTGDAGEQPGKPTCNNIKYTENTGLMNPYPAGLTLPDLDTRPSCTQMWPPVFADADAKPLGGFSVVTRQDGTKQWAYDGYALYTSALDKISGQVNGASTRDGNFDSPVLRKPVGPPAEVPPGFAVKTVATGRILTTSVGYSAYSRDGDVLGKSNCADDCLKDWRPVVAGEFAVSQREWDVIERSPGIKQWVFRGKPLYTHVLDHHFRSLEGSDVPGWHNVYAQMNPAVPAEFTVQDSLVGQVLADKDGKTMYVYTCGDDAFDQLACDHPTTTQAYRLAVCGGGKVARCIETWRYVPAPANASSDSLIWRAAWLNPDTGRFAEPNSPGALHVWTFRDRPIYTFSRDERPGDAAGDSWGEYVGARNGFKAFWLSDNFKTNSD
jgi:predicted lipoprotein with Yx(FWY)xxD motif